MNAPNGSGEIQLVTPRRKLTTLCHLCRFAALSFAVVTGLASNAIAQSDQPFQRPETQHLLPETTVGLLKLRDFPGFIEKIKDSSAGKFTQSDSVAPLANSLYVHATNLYDSVSDKVGLSLEQIQSLPTGEMTVAWILPRQGDMAFVVMIETDEENEVIKKWLERGRELYEEATGVSGDETATKGESEENELGIEIETVFTTITGQPSYFAYYDGLLIGSTSKQELEDIFTRWGGGEVAKIRPLSENRKFVTISKRCAVSDDVLPDLSFYADPIRIFKSAAIYDTRMQFGVALLPTLGFDGVLAFGGNVYLSHENYEWISHGHLLLGSPQEGILNALAFKPDDYTPEPWVPVELAQYMTTSWDIPQMMASIQKIQKGVEEDRLAYDRAEARDRFETPHEAERKASEEDVAVLYEKLLENMQEELDDRKVDMDVHADLIAHLSGRVTVVRPILSGGQLNGIGNAISLGLSDTESLEESLQKLMAVEDLTTQYSEREYRGVKFWEASEESVKMRQPKIAFGVIGYQFVVSDSEEFFETAIDTFNGDEPPLANDKAFQKHVDATKLLRTDLPAAVFYFDSIRAVGFYLKAFEQDGVTEMLESQALSDETGFISVIRASIEEHGIPTTEEIEKYLSTCGGFVTTDDSGYHFLFFQERP